jgi:hypothetical protein
MRCKGLSTSAMAQLRWPVKLKLDPFSCAVHTVQYAALCSRHYERLLISHLALIIRTISGALMDWQSLGRRQSSPEDGW